MKTILSAFLLFAITLSAEEKKPEPPSLPVKMVLKNGAVLNSVKVVRWEKDCVVLKHGSGVDPIRFEWMSPEDRKAFEANKDAGLTVEGAKRASKQEEAALRERASQAIAKHSLIIGMTSEEAIRSWGRPDKVNGGSDSHEQWVYNRDSIDNSVYVYFKSGRLTSWQDSR